MIYWNATSLKRSWGCPTVYRDILLTVLGWFFVVLGVIGIVLPILPTTPFLIVALALFAKSSPRFHRMLINNAWFGASLKQWEDQKTVLRRTKLKALALVVISFSVSIAVLYGRYKLQVLLVVLALVLMVFIWRIKEPPN